MQKQLYLFQAYLSEAGKRCELILHCNEAAKASMGNEKKVDPTKMARKRDPLYRVEHKNICGRWILMIMPKNIGNVIQLFLLWCSYIIPLLFLLYCSVIPTIPIPNTYSYIYIYIHIYIYINMKRSDPTSHHPSSSCPGALGPWGALGSGAPWPSLPFLVRDAPEFSSTATTSARPWRTAWSRGVSPGSCWWEWMGWKWRVLWSTIVGIWWYSYRYHSYIDTQWL